MSQAPDYTPITSFADDESNQASGRAPVRTQKLDDEFANIEASLNTINANLQKVQRDDGKLKDLIVEPYALSEQTRALLSAKGAFRGTWQPNTYYKFGEFLQYNGFAYVAQFDHLSSPAFNQALWLGISGDGSASISAAEASASALSAINAANAAGISATTATEQATSATASALTASTASNNATNRALESLTSSQTAVAAAISAQESESNASAYSIIAAANGIIEGVTTGTSSAYLLDPVAEIVTIQNRQIVPIKFHVDCANNATVKIGDIEPPANLVFYDADDELVNVAAGDIRANQSYIGMIIDNGARLLIEPTAEATTINSVATTPVTLTKTALGSLQILLVNDGVVNLPPLADFKDGTGLSFYSLQPQAYLNASGADLIIRDGADNQTVVGLRYLETATLIKHTGKWLCIRPYRKRQYSNLPAASTILLGDTIQYTLTGATSFPLNINTPDGGVYRMLFRETTRGTATSANPVTLSVAGLTASSITANGVVSYSTATAHTPATGSEFFLTNPGRGAVYMFDATLDLTTSLKSCSSKNVTNASSLVHFGDVISISSDKTNPVTSIGSINCVNALSGTLTIERIA